jgi:hypothetical protein
LHIAQPGSPRLLSQARSAAITRIIVTAKSQVNNDILAFIKELVFAAGLRLASYCVIAFKELDLLHLSQETVVSFR